ncbi:hypothetical protein H4582DRAFT_1854555 [Lactarius indigo]|nr:hypothetical protein H4582DRAFT_1854555 [Lactarius indigo]
MLYSNFTEAKSHVTRLVRSQFPAAEFAFPFACHTAELTEDTITAEVLHLAVAMQYCGFRGVVWTM